MEKKIVSIILFIFILSNSSLQQVFQLVKLDGNNISSYFFNHGVFDNKFSAGNIGGFEWPKGSGKTAVYTAGLNIAGFINTIQGFKFAMCSASYFGEWCPSYIPIPHPGMEGLPGPQPGFKIYKVIKNLHGEFDWNSWGLMVPYGAPYTDVNNNCQYDPDIDIPGIKNASQTIFICMTDAVLSQRRPGEGFGGGVCYPYFYAEVHMTTWCYDSLNLNDVQFIKWNIINKSDSNWYRLLGSIYIDPDLGNPKDDMIGCDTSRKLAYCYNATNYDSIYGAAPPAVGFIMLKGFKSSNTGDSWLNSVNRFIHTGIGGPLCESGADEPYSAYLCMQGYKNDSTDWMDITQTPYRKTKFVFSGDPETNTGWTENKGSLNNCGHDTTGTIITHPGGYDAHILLNTGSYNLTVHPGDTTEIIIAQLIARGTSNLNSVTRLKQYADSVWTFYDSIKGQIEFINCYQQTQIPRNYFLYQNFPNPFNPKTTIKFDIMQISGNETQDVQLIVYDLLGREIQKPVNQQLKAGTYEIIFNGNNLPSGVYFYKLSAGDFSMTRKMILIK
jgi:hypothetical protein